MKKSPLTRIDPIPDTPSGWVTSAYPEPGQHSLVFGYHQPHHLTAIARVNLENGSMEHLGSLPSPSILQIASTAYDNNLKLLFYTANNNKLFRDIYVLSTASKKNKLLFPDCRVGQITVSPTSHELWGIQHYVGKSTLVYSAYPYRDLVPVVGFDVGDNLQQLSVSPSGRYLAAILHQASGRQALIVSDLQRIRDGKNFSFEVISEEGSPGNPSWSPDEAYIYWNAYINGVSNIYRYDRKTGTILPFSNVVRGLFKPVYINKDSIFAFEFTSQGFRPVIIPNQPAERLSAIEYFGQQVVDKNSEVTKWSLPAPRPVQSTGDNLPGASSFQPLKHLQIQSFIPVVTGFQSQVAVGIYAQISDPLLSNFFTVEAAVTPKRDNSLQPRFHIKMKYEYMRKYIFSVSHNAPNFYDLLNDRKQGMIGNKFTAGYRRFIKYDIPHKIEWDSEAALYTGIVAINDNLVKVTRPDFIVLQSAVKSHNTRRAIGSIDNESGSEWEFTGMFFGVEPRRMTVVGGFHAAAGYYRPFLIPHNIFHVKVSAGYRYTKSYLSIGKFYFGGFGNRIVDRANVKQYRKVFRFPGIPIYSLPGDRFVKLMMEHNLPPFRPGKLFLGEHYLSNINFSWYSQGLWIHSPLADLWGDLGAQLNFVFKHWFNLQSTLSVGAARAWSRSGNDWEWFISVKLLKH